MNIFYDFEIDKTKEQLEDIYSGETGVLFTTIKRLIKERWVVLNDEIEIHKDHKVILEIGHSPFRIKFKYFHLPAKTTHRMEESMDSEYLSHISNEVRRLTK